jgi:hypothetical protein
MRAWTLVVLSREQTTKGRPDSEPLERVTRDVLRSQPLLSPPAPGSTAGRIT